MADKESLLQYLPGVLQRAPAGLAPDQESLLARFLKIFEQQFQKLDSQVDRIPHLFDPWKAEAKFLPYLASWLALELDEEDWGEGTQRALIDKILSIYHTRGTLRGLETILKIYLGEAVKEIKEHGSQPHVFTVTINFPKFDVEELARRTRAIRKAIEREKPAHTDYEWNIITPTLQIGVHSTIGVDTILGTSPNPETE